MSCFCSNLKSKLKQFLPNAAGVSTFDKGPCFYALFMYMYFFNWSLQSKGARMVAIEWRIISSKLLGVLNGVKTLHVWEFPQYLIYVKLYIIMNLGTFCFLNEFKWCSDYASDLPWIVESHSFHPIIICIMVNKNPNSFRASMYLGPSCSFNC